MYRELFFMLGAHDVSSFFVVVFVFGGVRSFRMSQFYSWYYHTLPFLLWQTSLPVALRLVVLCGVELGFNVFPATALSSAVLQVGWLHRARHSYIEYRALGATLDKCSGRAT